MDKFLQEKLNQKSYPAQNVQPTSPASASAAVVRQEQESDAVVKVRWLGRARRSEYLPIAIIINGILVAIDKSNTESIGLGVVSLILLIIVVIESIRRLHDMGKSGWWVIAFIIPFVWFMTWCKGQDGPNEYGPDPRA